MNDNEKQLAIASALLSLIFDIPLMTLIVLWAIILICTIRNKEAFTNTLKVMAVATVVWVVGIVLVYYIIWLI